MSNVMVNIGTSERPCFVPENALIAPQSPGGNSWWGKVATGSVIVPERELLKALKISGKAGGSNGNKQS